MGKCPDEAEKGEYTCLESCQAKKRAGLGFWKLGLTKTCLINDEAPSRAYFVVAAFGDIENNSFWTATNFFLSSNGVKIELRMILPQKIKENLD
uniref:Uncharacterized protein n=1 Tax=Romanomermis culicivorax TaxID=13658 RepID=A0A915J9K3_ROMCU